ncbi:hypothetical protein EVA_09112 [gut metagenome]|uniref:Uncharacterized protein n=1 Tax=gut metagenome TaxID=749906 RepID=J9CRG9_9ZZZZ
MEVCQSFASRPQQQDFWIFLKSFVFSSENQYQELLQRAACSVKENSLKALAVNLSCNAFSDERELLCRQAEKGMENSWIQWLSPAENMQKSVNEWLKKGVSVFLLNTSEFKSCPDKLTRLPMQNRRCVFIYVVSDGEMDFHGLRKLRRQTIFVCCSVLHLSTVSHHGSKKSSYFSA